MAAPVFLKSERELAMEDLPEEMQKHLSQEEIQWVMSTEVADTPEDLELFAR